MTQKPRSVSEILDFQTCPALHAYKHVARRESRGRRSRALTLGTVVHKLFENYDPHREDHQHINTWAFSGALFLHEVWPDPDEKMFQTLQNLTYFAHGWATSPTTRWNSLAREAVFHSRDGRLKVKIDDLEQDPIVSGILHRQYKTSSENPEILAKALELSLHEGAYASVLREKFPQLRYLGTELVVISKESRYAREAGSTDDQGRKGYRLKNWTEGVSVHRLPVTDDLQSRARSSFSFWTNQIEWAEGLEWDGRTRFPIHTDNCLRHGTLCEFHGVCSGTDRLDDEILFQDLNPDERYGEIIPLTSDDSEA